MPKPKPKAKSILLIREYLEAVELIRALNMDLLSIYTQTRADAYNGPASKDLVDSLTASAKRLATRLETLLDS